MTKSILTLTVNPAIDRIITVDRLVFEDRAYILSATDAAGGRGINAARVLTSFGAQTIAVTTSGRDVGRKFEELLEHDGFSTQIVKIRHDIRTNLTISDRQGLSVKLNELGPEISKSEMTRVQNAVEKLLPSASWLMLCGSLPPGVDPHFYTHLIRLAAKHNVKSLLDTDGDPLLHGIEGMPTILSPNQSEAERLLNRALITRSHWIEAVQQMKSMGPKYVVLSLGSRGVVAASDEGVLENSRRRASRSTQPHRRGRCLGGRCHRVRVPRAGRKLRRRAPLGSRGRYRFRQEAARHQPCFHGTGTRDLSLGHCRQDSLN